MFKNYKEHYLVPHIEYFEVDLLTKQVQKLNLPLDRGSSRTCVLVENDKAYITINDGIGNNDVWIYQTKNQSLKKGLHFEGNIDYIFRLERLHASRHGVFGQSLEIGIPVRVHRPEGFKTTANPFLKFLVPPLGGWLDAVVNRAKANTPLHQRANFFKPVALQERMPASAVAVHHDGRRALKHLFIAHPAVGMHFDHDAGNPLQAFREQTPGWVREVLARVSA